MHEQGLGVGAKRPIGIMAAAILFDDVAVSLRGYEYVRGIKTLKRGLRVLTGARRRKCRRGGLFHAIRALPV
jgi:hypothetical protein